MAQDHAEQHEEQDQVGKHEEHNQLVEQQQQQGYPTLTLGLGDLEGLQQVLTIYLRYLKAHGTTSQAAAQRHQLLTGLRSRIEGARRSRLDPVCLPLTLEEWRGLKKALAGCAWVIRIYAKSTPERDELLIVLETLKLRVAQMIATALN